LNSKASSTAKPAPSAFKGRLTTLLRFDATKRPARNYFSRREQWRLLLLVMSLGVVMLVMRELHEPENAVRVAQVFAGDAATSNDGKILSEPPPKTGSDTFRAGAPADQNQRIESRGLTSPPAQSLDALLSLAGWTPKRFAKFTDGEELTGAERDELIQLLWRVRTFDAALFEPLIGHPMLYRGNLLHVKGQARNWVRHELEPEEAGRFEMPAYYTCDVEHESKKSWAVVVTAAVPARWEQRPSLDEPVSLSGLYVKQLPAKTDDQGNRLPVYLVVARRIAWHPATPREPVVSLGMSILGSLGMDVGLLDRVTSHGRLHTTDAAKASQFNDQREAFYQMLDAAGQIGAHQLVRYANSNLETIRAQWAQEMKETGDANRKALAREVIERAKAGRYSVAPLFNDAARQIGQLIVVDGAARRVVRVDLGTTDGGTASDVARRFGFDHYYEMQVFTDDSQNFPLVFCVRELPAGMPTGDDLHVPVRVAGFFFKDWLYTTRGTRDEETSKLDPSNGKPQFAPLLVGRAPIHLQFEDKGRGATQLVGGGLFVLALGGIWAAAWWLSRGDRRIAERRRLAVHSLPPGQSLNDLHVPTVDEPIMDEG
jgi:hypothetical protein